MPRREQTRDYCCFIFGDRAGTLKPGDVIAATVTISADEERHAWLMVARHGNGPWESSGQRESIGAQAKTVTVSHTLQHPHELFRVQVSPAIRWSESAMVRLEDIRIDVRRNNNVLGSYILKPTALETPCPASASHRPVENALTDPSHHSKPALRLAASIDLEKTPSYPYVFGSTICRAQHFRMPLYRYWCAQFGEIPVYHRKQWGFIFICQVLHERQMLTEGRSAIGFGLGREPLASVFASRGVAVLASDMNIESARELGWVSTQQHSHHVAELNDRGLCDAEQFNRLVSFREIDMNAIPSDLGRFDFCWSSCAFEHLGSIRQGLAFVINSVALLRPGGVAVHTTEFNLSSDDKTIDNNRDLVIFRRRDIELLVTDLQEAGHTVEERDYYPGCEEAETYVDMPPYVHDPHLRLQLGEFVSTSIGLIIRHTDKEH